MYVFYTKANPPVAALVSSSTSSSVVPSTTTGDDKTAITQDFLTLLLGVKSIKLDDSIFKDPAFINLHDSSISLTPDGTEGRPNPFAPIGNDTSTSATTPVTQNPVTH